MEAIIWVYYLTFDPAGAEGEKLYGFLIKPPKPYYGNTDP